MHDADQPVTGHVPPVGQVTLLGDQRGIEPAQRGQAGRVGRPPVRQQRGERVHRRLDQAGGGHAPARPGASAERHISGPGKYAPTRSAGLNTMCGTRPSAHCARNRLASSRQARSGRTWASPIAMNAESQLHWCG